MAETPVRQRLSNDSPRLVRACALFVVITLLVVPALLRATQSFATNTGNSSIRLNRGFDAPESKCKVTPPAAVMAAIRVPEPTAERSEQSYNAGVDLIVVSQHDVPPDAFRGPPVSFTVA